MNTKPVVIVGIGEIGSVFARGFLRCGSPIYPVNRNTTMEAVAQDLPGPELVLVGVGETDLHPVISNVPEPWRDRLVLIQNELLPRDWERYSLSPTVLSVWFEKKRGQDVKIVVPSVVFGPNSAEVSRALDALDIPCTELHAAEQLVFELVRKNLYILVSNICGLKAGGTVSALWSEHQELARSVVKDVIAIQQWLVGQELDSEKLVAAMVVAFNGDPEHKCMGRSAPARLQRALAIADEAGLDVPTLRKIQRDIAS